MKRTSLKSLLERARKGDAAAQFEVGSYYQDRFLNGSRKRIIAKDPAKAVYWYRLAADQGYRAAQNQLGVCLSAGIGVRRDLHQAITWTKLALAQDDPTAAHNLATIYRDMGLYHKAFALYKRAAAMGEMESLLEIGLSLYYGIGAKKDPQAACKYFQQVLKAKPSEVSEHSRADACHMLGVACLEGKGIKRSVAKARSFLEMANKDEDHRASQLLLTLTGRSRGK